MKRESSLRLCFQPLVLSEAIKDQEENHGYLKNLLQGIFLVREATKRTMDYVLSFGERNSAYLIIRPMKI